ncbi:hypothetical protein M422DRAFT_68581 [Sphaerobolus stellatus SS14]|uniref:BTB domain-containing protein n=1 Tax=Sphaerobolus stellatus (strain SS14) TaxID=990650 RepID=A0A0C9VPZ8_SPHS4|nr:hypothetical protein M422DRAFT_68581 [Sphaerobolus stellatus SS14]
MNTNQDSSYVNHINHPPFWHEDGDIILSALDPGANTECKFRVHKVLLSLQSPVFRDMFSMGGRNRDDSEDPCPVVPLRDDSVDDVRALLTVLYNGFGLYEDTPSISFDEAIGVLKLSHKYQMEQLRKGIIRLLKRSWPLDRDEFVTIMKQSAIYPSASRIRNCVQLVNAAHIADAYELLPTALYELAILKPNPQDQAFMRLRGLSSEDLYHISIGKSRMIERYKSLEIASSGDISLTVWDIKLPKKDQIPIFTERQRYRTCAQQKSKVFANQWNAETNSVEQEVAEVYFCKEVFDSWKKIICECLYHQSYGIGGFSDGITAKYFTTASACSGCAKWMMVLIKNKATEVWQNIPADFDLPEIKPSEYLPDARPPPYI